MANPKCPYCGEEMKLWDDGCGMLWYSCPKCLAEAPVAHSEEAALAAAMKRDRVKGEWVHYKVRHSLPMDCPPYYGEEYDRETHSCLDDEWHCSNCDYITDEIDKEWMNFCPNCGTEMRKEANDER